MMRSMRERVLGFEPSPAQREAIEWGSGPLMVLAGAGTGKTTVVVERVRHLLDRDRSLTPENILVLTYNVRAAGVLLERFEQALGVERASRLWVHNFHSFGYRLLRAHPAEAGLNAGAGMLDAIGQRLLLRDLRPRMSHFLYHRLDRDPMPTLGGFADMISRAKDELVTPAEYAAFVERRKDAFAARFGTDAWDEAVDALREREAANGLGPIKQVRGEYAKGGDEAAAKRADREARRTAGGTGRAVGWKTLDDGQRDLAEGLKETYLRDAHAYDVLRLQEEAEAYALYQAELARRGALDFGEQMLRAIELLTERPNLLLRYQRQFRHVLVDEFQDANMAQIALLELVGRGPDKPDDVVVVGDDDQSIYRFRGASYAAFSRFEERFGQPPSWDPDRPAQAVERVSLLENRRSVGHVLAAADRLIAHNSTRLKVDQPLRPTRDAGAAVEVVVAADEQDEADAIVERIRATYEALPEPRAWSDIAVLYRRHAHREHIVERLRRSGIPYAVVGATGLFLQPEIRDLEAAMRVLADPTDSVSFTRMLTSGPWRLDAAEIIGLRRAADFDGRPMLQAAREVLDADRATIPVAVRTKLARLFGCIEDLIPRAAREGPLVLMEEYVVRTNLVHDLIVTGTPEAHRAVLDIARFLRFAADHQASRPRDSLVDFIAYVDLYQEVGGDLEIETPVSAGVSGVQLMTIYQAKGLEYPAVVVPRVVEGQFPDTRGERLLLPVELLKQTPPAQFAEEEERRLLFVAMTRARDRLLVTTIAQPGSRLRPSRFVAEVAPQLDSDPNDPTTTNEAPADVVVVKRSERPEPEVETVPGSEDGGPAITDDDGGSLEGWATVAEAAAPDAGTAALERLMPVPTAFERRYGLRRRAVELIGMLEQLDPADEAGRAAVLHELVTVATDAAGAAAEERRRGIDPLTMRVIARHAPAGEALLSIAPLPSAFSHSQFRTYGECGLRYAFERIYRIPTAETKGFFEFGTLVHATFEDFVKRRREAHAAGEPEPTFEDLRAAFDARWTPETYADAQEAQHFQRRSGHLLERFYARELASLSEAIGIEQGFTLELDPPDGGAPIRLRGVLDRIDRHPDGSIEVLDYKTGKAKSQGWVDKDEQLTTYALALARGAVIEEATGEPIAAASKLTLYFTESDQAISTTRTPEQLAAHEAHLVETAMRIRSGDFTATPDYRRCGWCDFRRICPSRYRTPEG